MLAAYVRAKQIFGIYYRDAAGSYAAISDATLSNLADKYRLFYDRPYLDIFHELGITLFVADTQGTENAAYAKIPDLHPLASLSGFTVYTPNK